MKYAQWNIKSAHWLLGLLLLAPDVKAQVVPAPSLMNFQGRLAKPDGTPLPDGTHQVDFQFMERARPAASSSGVRRFPRLPRKTGLFAALLNVGTGARHAV